MLYLGTPCLLTAPYQCHVLLTLLRSWRILDLGWNQGLRFMREGSNPGDPSDMQQIELHSSICFPALSSTTIHSMHLLHRLTIHCPLPCNSCSEVPRMLMPLQQDLHWPPPMVPPSCPSHFINDMTQSKKNANVLIATTTTIIILLALSCYHYIGLLQQYYVEY